jgi:tyrosine-protein kinase Etk/Wzc
MNTQSSESYPPNLNLGDDDSIDFKRFISLFISNWYWFAISLFITISIAYGINRWSEKVYTVSSTLLLNDDRSGALTDIFPGSEGFRSQQKVNNEMGILRSFYLNDKVMRKLHEFNVVYTSVGKRGIAESRLYKSAPFKVIFDSLELQPQSKKVNIKITSDDRYELELDGEKKYDGLFFGEGFREEGFDFKLILRDTNFKFNPEFSNTYHFYFTNPVSMANNYRSKLSVVPVAEEASLVTLTTTGFVIEQEADYLNTLMEVYLESGLEYKNQTTDQMIAFIEGQLATVSDSLKDAENNLENFRLLNKLINISQEGVVIQEKLEKIDVEKTRLLIQKNYYMYLNKYIEDRDGNSDIVAPSIMGVTDQLLLRLVEDLSGLQKEKRQLSINLYESAEPLRVIETSISNARKAIYENISDGLRNIELQIEETDKILNNIENEIKRLPSTERRMINIQRQFDINNTVYTFLLEKRAEAGIARASNVPDNRVIDHAGLYNSTRIKPKENKNFLISIILGLLFPLFGILTIDYFNNRIIDKKDIERRTNAPVIGYISHNVLKTEMPVAENPGSTLSESFRSIRTNMKYFLKEKTCPIIAVSSTITAEGKTFISANLAAILALSGKRILLVGLDLRKPRIHKIFGINNEKGISNILIGEEKLDDVLVKTEVANLWYMPSGPVPPNPAELIESNAMNEFIKDASSMFDVIVLDTPPVALVTDALLVSAFTDLYLFVVRQRYSSKDTIDLIDELYRSGKFKSLGIVVNDISVSGYYGYGLRYGYALGYGYNYGYNYNYRYGKYGDPTSSKGYFKEV